MPNGGPVADVEEEPFRNDLLPESGSPLNLAIRRECFRREFDEAAHLEGRLVHWRLGEERDGFYLTCEDAAVVPPSAWKRTPAQHVIDRLRTEIRALTEARGAAAAQRAPGAKA
jgi:hypothetical protein